MSRDKKKKLSHRTTDVVYDGCRMFSPDGVLMCTLSKKRAKWYLDKDLAEEMDVEGPLSIRLKFEPKGPGTPDIEYYLHGRDNKCVVCGISEYLTRHHIVPYAFRRFFPGDLSENNSYDVVPLCAECHEAYEKKADGLRDELCEKYGVPRSGVQPVYDKELHKAAKYSNAILKQSETIPEDVLEDMKVHLQEFLGKEEVTDDDLESLREQRWTFVEESKSFAELIMKQVEDLDEFVFIWRDHFLEHAQPKYLHESWDPRKPIRECRGGDDVMRREKYEED